MEQQNAAHLGDGAHSQACEAALAGEGIDAFGRGGPLFVDLFGCIAAHALAPLADRVAVVFLAGVGIGVGVFRFEHRGIDDGVLGGVLDLLMGRVTAIDQPFVGVTAVALADLLDHGGQLRHVGTDRDRFDTDDHLAGGVGGELGVVGRPKAAVGHLHDGGLGIGGGGPRRLARFSLFSLDLGHLGQALQRPLDALLTLPGGALAGSLLAAGDGAGVLLDLALEPLDLGTRLLQALLQRGAATERGGPGTGAHPRTVLGNALEGHHAFGQQQRNILAEQGIERLLVGTAEVRKSVVVDRHSAADPAVDIVLLDQPGDRPRAAHPVEGRVQPQGEQDFRGDGGAPAATFQRADVSVHAAQVGPLDPRPHQTRTVPVRQQGLQVAGTQLQLRSVGQQNPRDARRFGFWRSWATTSKWS